MKKTIIIIALLLVPALLIASGLYFKQDVLSSIGYVVLIFYFILAIRGRFTTSKKNKPS